MPQKRDVETECQNQAQHVELERLVAAHHGNLSAISRELSASGDVISREGVAVRLRTHGLFKKATEARAASLVGGPRSARPGAFEPERQRLLKAIDGAQTYEEAQELLGMSRRTFYRKLKQFKVSQRAVARFSARAKRPSPTEAQVRAVIDLVSARPEITATEIAARLKLERWDAIARCRAAETSGLLVRIGKARFRLASDSAVAAS